MAIGGEFSFCEIIQSISLSRRDFRSYFPLKLGVLNRAFFLTGADSLAAIFNEILEQRSSLQVFVPEHYCYSSLERALGKTLRSKISIISY